MKRAGAFQLARALRLFVRLPPAPHKPKDQSGYDGQRRILGDRRVSLHDLPLRAEPPPQADERRVVEAG